MKPKALMGLLLCILTTMLVGTAWALDEAVLTPTPERMVAGLSTAEQEKEKADAEKLMSIELQDEAEKWLQGVIDEVSPKVELVLLCRQQSANARQSDWPGLGWPTASQKIADSLTADSIEVKQLLLELLLLLRSDGHTHP